MNLRSLAGRNMEATRPCPGCGGSQLREVYDARRQAFGVLRCGSCGLVFSTRIFEEHETGATVSAYDQERVHREARKPDLNWDIHQKIEELTGGGVLLDVGCGTGRFLAKFDQNTYELYGIEPNPLAAAVAGDRTCARIISKLYARDVFPKDSADVISFIQVMEHMRDPRDILATAFHHARPGGLLVIDVPSFSNPRLLLYRMLRVRALARRDFIPAHLYYFTPRTLSALVEEAGFRVIRVQTGRYGVKFGDSRPAVSRLLRPLDVLAQWLKIGGIVLYAQKDGS